MTQSKCGLEIFDDQGLPVLEIGSHIIKESPRFAEKIGAISASWSQAEVHLNCLFATLLDTTPEEAALELKKYRNAARATDGARKIAEATLSGSEFLRITDTLDKLDTVRERRNRVQHDVWAKKGNDNSVMYAVRPTDYFNFITKILSIAEEKSQKTTTDCVISLSMNFASTITIGHTISDLEAIAQEIDSISESLQKSMFSRITQRIANSRLREDQS